MKDSKLENLLNQNKTLQILETDSILIVEEDYYNSSDIEGSININNILFSVKMLKNLLSSNYYFNYIKKLFNNELPYLKVYLVNTVANLYIGLSKFDIVDALNQILTRKIGAPLDEKQMNRYNSLLKEVSYEKFQEKNIGNNYHIVIDRNEYSIPIIDILSFLELPEEKYLKLCQLKEFTKINGIPKEHFIYATKSYFQENNITKNYVIPQTILDRLIEIKTNEYVDIEAINKVTITTNKQIPIITINPDLVIYIFDGLPDNLTEIEKVIYIYIKLCRSLAFTDNEDENKIISIGTSVSFDEFNAVFCKMLEEIGIEIFSNEYLLNTIGGKEYTEFRSDKYLLKTSSTKEELKEEMNNIKLNKKPEELICLNNNRSTVLTFEEKVNNIHLLISEKPSIIAGEEKFEEIPKVVEEKEENLVAEKVEVNLSELLPQYIQTREKIVEISLNEKISIFMDKADTTKLKGMEMLTYILELRKIIFSDEEIKNNIKITIINDKENAGANKPPLASAVLTISDTNAMEDIQNNIYYYYHPASSFTRISLTDLQDKFKKGLFSYIPEETVKLPEVPGIETKGGNN